MRPELASCSTCSSRNPPIEFGSGPLMLLLFRYSHLSRVRFPSPSGNGPGRPVLSSRSRSSLVRFPISVGSAVVIGLLYSSRVSSSVSCPISGGIAVMLFPYRYSHCRFVRLPIDAGIDVIPAREI